MTSKPEITTRLASRLKEERAEKGLSLDALAKLSGVSRSMLSQIERGESSPTVASLWNLTRALNVDFSALLDQEAEPEHPIREVLRQGQTPVIRNKESGCVIRILSAPEEAGDTEVYDIEFEQGAHLQSAAHRSGCVEHITVISGNLRITSGSEEASAAIGDTIRYAADTEHSIMAVTTSRALLIVRNA